MPVLTSQSGSQQTTDDSKTNMQHQPVPGQSKSVLVRSRKAAKLTVNQVNVIDIPPRENVSYSKETQTPSTDIVLDKDAKPLDYYGLSCFFIINLNHLIL